MSFPGDGPCMFAVGACLTCKRTFTFNPLTVPSSSALTGEREPVCADCMELINLRRQSRGLPAFAIAADAYGVADA